MDITKYVKITSIIIVCLIMIILIFNTNPYIQSFMTGIVLAMLVYGSIYVYTNSKKYTGAEENSNKCLSDAYVKYTKMMDDCDANTCKGSDNYKECVDFGKSMRKANGYMSTRSFDSSNDRVKPSTNEYTKPAASEYARQGVYKKSEESVYQNTEYPVGDEHGYAYMPSVESMSKNTSTRSSYGDIPSGNLLSNNARKNGYANIKLPNNTGKSMYDSTDSSMLDDPEYVNKPLPSLPGKK